MKVTITTEVEVPKEWTDFCLCGNDLFRRDHCGYWMFGVQHQPFLGWLVYVADEGEAPTADAAMAATDAWRKSFGPLPDGFYRLGPGAAAEAFKAGCMKWGVGWYDDPATDALRYDYVIQVALLGKVVYG